MEMLRLLDVNKYIPLNEGQIHDNKEEQMITSGAKFLFYEFGRLHCLVSVFRWTA